MVTTHPAGSAPGIDLAYLEELTNDLETEGLMSTATELRERIAAARRAPQPSADGTPAAWCDALRRSGADTDYHGKIVFTAAQFAQFKAMVSGRADRAPADGAGEDEAEFVATLKGAAQEATDEWIAGFVRQHFRVYRAPTAAPADGAGEPAAWMRKLEDGTKMGVSFDKVDEPLIDGWVQVPLFDRAPTAGDSPTCHECKGAGGKQVGTGLFGPDWQECAACSGAGDSTSPQPGIDERTVSTVLQDIVHDGYLSESNAHRARAALTRRAPPAVSLNAILSCYSPDDTAGDYQDKIRALFGQQGAAQAQAGEDDAALLLAELLTAESQSFEGTGTILFKGVERDDWPDRAYDWMERRAAVAAPAQRNGVDK
jgi:hypothetical protein